MESIDKASKKYLVLSVICFSLFMTVAVPAYTVEYEYTVLIPEGWDYTIALGLGDSDALGINNNGVVVGYGGGDIITNMGFIYNNGVYTELLPEGWASAGAYGVNNEGVVVGTGTGHSAGYAIVEGFIYDDGVYTFLQPEGWPSAHAYGINDAGVVVGEVFSLDQVKGRLQGFIYSGGEYTFLLPEGWWEAYAVDINNNGVVIGSGWDDKAQKGFIYNNGVYTELLPEGWLYAKANGINKYGVVVGEGMDSNQINKGFIYHDGEYTILLPEGEEYAYAKGINNEGVVIGNAGSFTYNTNKFFTYNKGIYAFFVPPEEWNYAIPLDINDGGVVVGVGGDSQADFTFIATPKVQPPCSAEAIYGENSKETKLLRNFRNNILSKTPAGQEIIKLYYLWSPMIVKAMEHNEAFKQDVKEIFDEVLSLIE